MRNIIFFLCLLLTLSSCELVGDIFEAGFNTALVIVLVIVILAIWLIVRARRRG